MVFEAVPNLYLKYVVISFLACICNAIYQGFSVSYYAIILIVIIYDFVTGQLMNRLCAILSVSATVVSFLFFMFFKSVCFSDVGEMVAAIQQRYSGEVIGTPLLYELFLSTKDNLNTFTVEFFSGVTGEYPREHLFLTLLLLMPLLSNLGLVEPPVRCK